MELKPDVTNMPPADERFVGLPESEASDQKKKVNASLDESLAKSSSNFWMFYREYLMLESSDQAL